MAFKEVNKPVWAVSIVFLVVSIVGCTVFRPLLSPTAMNTEVALLTDTPILITNTATRKPSLTDTPVPNLTNTATSRPSSTVSPTKTFVPTTNVAPLAASLESFVLPAWVSDPYNNVLLVATGTSRDGFQGLILVNASDGESVALPQLDIGGYFWTEDGKQIGLLLNNEKTVILINTLDGRTSTSAIDESAIRFISLPASFPRPLFALGNGVSSPGFALFPESWRERMSFDRQYLLEHDYEPISVLHIETQQSLQLTDPDDNLYVYATAWSPNQPYLAIAQSDEIMELGFGFSGTPHISLKVYDVSRGGELVGVYEAVTFPNWSPDGTKFLYQPLHEDSGSFWPSAPCVFDRLTNISKCYNDVVARHQSGNSRADFSSLAWLPDQTAISFVYFKIEADPYREMGGLCFVNLSDESERCILEEFEEVGQKIIRYHLSPDGKAVSFYYDDSCPSCDYLNNPQLAIADVNTGRYVVIGSFVVVGSELGVYGLWRPRVGP